MVSVHTSVHAESSGRSCPLSGRTGSPLSITKPTSSLFPLFFSSQSTIVTCLRLKGSRGFPDGELGRNGTNRGRGTDVAGGNSPLRKISARQSATFSSGHRIPIMVLWTHKRSTSNFQRSTCKPTSRGRCLLRQGYGRRDGAPRPRNYETNSPVMWLIWNGLCGRGKFPVGSLRGLLLTEQAPRRYEGGSVSGREFAL